MTDPTGTEALLARARSTYTPIDARTAAAEIASGDALLVDIRPEAQRREHGEVAASFRPLVVERNVLEWRFDPAGEARLPEAGADVRVIVLCQQGYASSLAAEALVRVGVPRATDVAGGFDAWVDAGLPVQGPPAQEDAEDAEDSEDSVA